MNEIGDIHSANDFFEFKLSIKNIIFIIIAWCIVIILIAIFMMGGINNTVDYVLNILNSTKNVIINNKNKQVGITIDKPIDNKTNVEEE